MTTLLIIWTISTLGVGMITMFVSILDAPYGEETPQGLRIYK